ncbi:Uncharacterised protein [Weissella viridescens]|uniref:Uncharacterized protein n=1 Tax=Weissella viridescens TaxID=1629 RepID=A0A380NZD1_WEIVI|nr:Uncharacterised protein [Weissella viridescens]
MRKFIVALVAILAMIGVGVFSYQYVQNKIMMKPLKLPKKL